MAMYPNDSLKSQKRRMQSIICEGYHGLGKTLDSNYYLYKSVNDYKNYVNNNAVLNSKIKTKIS